MPAFTRNILDWLGERGFVVLLAMLLVVGGTWGFIALADEVNEGDTQHFDKLIWEKTLSRTDDPSDTVGPRWLGEVMRDFTALGGVAVLSIITVTVAGYLVLDGKRRAATFVLLSILGGLLLSTALKRSFDRKRPPMELRAAYVYTSSFPSGHSMLSATVYLTLGSLLMRFQPRRRLKIYCLLIAVILTMLIGISRVYLRVHWTTDVLAGWTAGLVWALICWLAARVLQKQHTIERDYETTTRQPSS